MLNELCFTFLYDKYNYTYKISILGYQTKIPYFIERKTPCYSLLISHFLKVWEKISNLILLSNKK